MAGRALPWLLLLHGAASLLHFWHNAEHLADYPNLPRSITEASVYAAWLAIVSVGLAGFLAFHRRYIVIGLGLLALYAALGLGGLLHYTRAPMSAHTIGMNLTIWAEVGTAAAVLAVVAWLAMRTRADARS